MSQVNNMQDVLDSRDIIKRIEELEGEQNDLEETLQDALEAFGALEGEIEDMEEGEDDTLERERLSEYFDDVATARAALADWQDSDEPEELRILKAFADQFENYGDWDHGATLIAEDYFTEYCKQLCEDIGDFPSGIPDYIVIDWEATADNLKADYTEADFDGQTYFMRP